MDNKYIGHQLQMYGVEEYRLEGGKGGGMKMYNVRNCTGLEFLEPGEERKQSIKFVFSEE